MQLAGVLIFLGLASTVLRSRIQSKHFISGEYDLLSFFFHLSLHIQ